MSKKQVVVTGGGGFIGSHLCERLLSQGYQVVALDNFVTGNRKNWDELKKNPNFRGIEFDVSDPWTDQIVQVFPNSQVSGLLHFACPASPVDFDRIALEILRVDSVGTWNAVEFALKHGARFVLASTSEVYGDPLVHPQVETYWGNVNPIGERACYDEAKRFSEALVSTATKRAMPFRKGEKPTQLNGGMVRIFNTYGPRMRIDDGRVVPELCRQALEGRPFTLHGDGKQTRSFCYVDDLVTGILKYFESSEIEPINLGNPVERTMLDFAENIEKVLGKKIDRTFLPARPDDPARRRPEISRARERLGWEPKIDLETGLKSTIEFFKKELGQ